MSRLRIEECSLPSLSNLTYGFGRAMLSSGHPVLVVRFHGTAADKDAFDFASAIVMAGLEAWNPWAIILDLRELVYEWGDWMQNVLSAPDRWYESVCPMRAAFTGGKAPEDFPSAVVVSDLNEDGLTSLVRDEMRSDPGAILFQSVDDAGEKLTRLLAGVPLM